MQAHEAHSTQRSEEIPASKPVVSVIMIFLNAEPYIEEAIESVLAQSFDDWELLLVDDGSTDNSTAIALRYARRRPWNIRYLEHPGHENRGMSASRNLGIANAQGSYVGFLDSDDVWFPETLAHQVALLDATPEAGMVYGATQYWHSWSGKAEDASRDRVDFRKGRGIKPGSLVKPPSLLVHFLSNQGDVPGICSLLVRREVLLDLGGFENNFRGMHEDQVFYAKIGLKTPVLVTDACLARYRQHPKSTCAVAERTGQQYQSQLNYLRWLEAYLAKERIEDRSVRLVLQRELARYRHPMLNRLRGLIKNGRKQMKTTIKAMGRRRLNPRMHSWLRAHLKPQARPEVGQVRFGSLRRVTPISPHFGYDRGQPVDRYYIESFLLRHADDIRGRVLEVGDDSYTRMFGGRYVTTSDVLHVTEGYPGATIIADVADAPQIPSNSFDCIIFTQTLHLIYDLQAALRTLHRILKPGGVLLATVPGISQVDKGAWGNTWYWGFTTHSAKRLFAEAFRPALVSVEAKGNVLAATAFLHGLAAEELRQRELDESDPAYQVVITLRAVKEVAL